MKNYLRFVCSVCKRTTDKLVDPARFMPDKCTITLRCEGRLQPTEYRGSAEITSAPKVGITDWRARDASQSATSAPTAATIPDPVFINTATGGEQQLVIAAKLPSPPADDATLVVRFKQQVDSPKNYRQYTYRYDAPFDTVSGIESGLDKKVLRYNTGDLVEVYLNGVKQEAGTLPENYSLYDGTSTSSVPANTIHFNEIVSLPGVTQVDVVVSAAVPSTYLTLTLTRVLDDESRKRLGAWEGVNYVERIDSTGINGNYYLYFIDLTDATALKLNTVLTIDSVKNGLTDIPLSSCMILLARLTHRISGERDYSAIDRYTSVIVPLSTFSQERDYFKYSTVDKYPTLEITRTSTEEIYPPIIVRKYNAEETIKTITTNDGDEVIVDNSIIVGPDL